MASSCSAEKEGTGISACGYGVSCARGAVAVLSAPVWFSWETGWPTQPATHSATKQHNAFHRFFFKLIPPIDKKGSL
jgi:hypothetical protein